MKLITYLCFTLLSIVIQFCLMDYIRDDTTVFDLNSTIAKNLSSIFRTSKQKPYALYYRTEKNKFQVMNKSPIKYNNDSITEATLASSTNLGSTVFDLLYDENVSVTDIDSVTELLFTTSEFDNVTEITLFDKKPSTIRPTVIPKKISTNTCYCNLLFKVCDINCCCDNDCSDLEKSMIKNCEDSRKEKCEIRNKDYLYMCTSQLACNDELQSDLFGYLFCIGKVNLPKKLITSKNTHYALEGEHHLKWHITQKKKENHKFTKNLYTIGQQIWMVTNGTIDSLELPITVTNEYCNGYKAVKFLRKENIKCYVKLKDLHMLDVIKSSRETKIASPKENTQNSTKMDCTTLHCTNRTFVICDEHNCTEYNNSLHEPSCSESYCHNIGVKIEYEFYCNVSLITNVIVKFHVRTISLALEFVAQEITVNFNMGNSSVENIVKFSGNPGYIRGLPIIVSLSESNRTENFFNNSLGKSNYLLLPYNKDGRCVVTNLTHNIVQFGHNKRIICRAYFGPNLTINNGTDGCLIIQAKIDDLYGLRPNIFISPYGNPQDISDENWLSLQTYSKSNIYGEYNPKDSKLICYNLITRIAFTITFADTNNAKEENKIITAKVDSTTKNITFSIEDMSTVVTVDTIFIDLNKLSVHEYREHFYLPKDLIFSVSSSKGSFIKLQMYHVYLVLFCITNKITA